MNKDKRVENEIRQELLRNSQRLHTTKLGAERLIRNLSLTTADPVAWCKHQLKTATTFTENGKNYYVVGDDYVLTVNRHSYTIITAHRTDNNAEKLKIRKGTIWLIK